MQALTDDLVKEYLRAHGYARTLRAFEASLLTASAGAPPASKKSGKFECPLLDGTDASVPRLDRMVRVS